MKTKNDDLPPISGGKRRKTAAPADAGFQFRQSTAAIRTAHGVPMPPPTMPTTTPRSEALQKDLSELKSLVQDLVIFCASRIKRAAKTAVGDNIHRPGLKADILEGTLILLQLLADAASNIEKYEEGDTTSAMSLATTSRMGNGGAEEFFQHQRSIQTLLNKIKPYQNNHGAGTAGLEEFLLSVHAVWRSSDKIFVGHVYACSIDPFAFGLIKNFSNIFKKFLILFSPENIKAKYSRGIIEGMDESKINFGA